MSGLDCCMSPPSPSFTAYREPLHRRNPSDTHSSESQDDAVTVQKRQKEAMRLKYLRRRKRLKRKPEKTVGSNSHGSPGSSDSEQSGARKSLELLHIQKDIACKTLSLFHEDESSFSVTNGDTMSLQGAMLQDNSLRPAAKHGGVHRPSMSIQQKEEIMEDFLANFQSTCSTSKPTSITKSTNWYSNIFSGLFDFVANHIFTPNEDTSVKRDFKDDYNERIEEMAQRVIQRVCQVCPERYLPELHQLCVLPLKHKLNQKGITVGVCGPSQNLKNKLLKTIERKSLNVSNVSYRMCLDNSESGLEASLAYSCLPTEHAACSVYMYSMWLDGMDHLDTLRWLVDKDKDIAIQGRLLLLSPDLKSTTNTTSSHHVPRSLSIMSSFNHTPSLLQVSASPMTMPRPYCHSTPIRDTPTFTHPSTVVNQQIIKNTSQVYNKTAVVRYISHMIGAVVPEECLLEWPHPSEQSAFDIDSDSNEVKEEESGFEETDQLGKWLQTFNDNCDFLRQLSITSDTLHCVEYCATKLQCQLEDITGEIIRIESLLNHKRQLVDDIKHNWMLLDSRTKDSTLQRDLKIAYEHDIRATVCAIEKVTVDVIERFTRVCLPKLESLNRSQSMGSSSVTAWSAKDIRKLFKSELDRFSNEAIQCLNTVHSTLLFANMNSVIQLRVEEWAEFETLRQLSDAYLHMEHCETDITEMEDGQYLRREFNKASSISPRGLESVGCVHHLKSIPIDDVFFSVLLLLASKVFKKRCDKQIKADLRSVKEQFVQQCTEYIRSDSVQTQSTQYHVNLMSNLVFDYLDMFQKVYLPQFKHINDELQLGLIEARGKYKNVDLYFKHLINLKVYLEVKKSLYSGRVKRSSN